MRVPARLVSLALVATVGAHAASASADYELFPTLPAPEPARVEASDARASTPKRVWYGWQLLLVDALSDAALSIGINHWGSDAATALVATGAVGYVAGGPILHGIHRRRATVIGGSLALRVGLPLVAYGTLDGLATCRVGSASVPCSEPNVLAAIGLALGVLAAQVVDATALAREPAGVLLVDRPASALVEPSVGMVRDSERRTVPTMGVVVSF